MSNVMALNTAVAREPVSSAHVAAAANTELQRVWFSLLRTPWTSLAVLPTHEGVPTRLLVEGLVAVGRQHGARTVRLIDATGAQLGDVQRLTDACRASGDTSCVVVRVDSIDADPKALAIVRSASAILLVGTLGVTRLAPAAALVNAVGRDRVVGCVLVK